jgi:hypothetical protein
MSTANLETEAMQRSIQLLGNEVKPRIIDALRDLAKVPPFSK